MLWHFVRYGDVLVITKLDRLARSVVNLANIVQKFEVKNVDLMVLYQGIDTTSIYGRLQCNILVAIEDFERGIIRKWSLEGRMRALAREVKFGARPKLTKEEISELISDYETPGCSKMEIVKHYGISRSSVYRLYTENLQKSANKCRIIGKARLAIQASFLCIEYREKQEWATYFRMVFRPSDFCGYRMVITLSQPRHSQDYFVQ